MTKNNPHTNYSKSSFITILAFFFEFMTIVIILLLTDKLIAHFNKQSTLITFQFSYEALFSSLLLTQYLLLVIEIIARKRSDLRSFTLPIVLLPFGNILRFCFMIALEFLIIIPKFTAYFLYVTIGTFINLFTDKLLNATGHRLIDKFDRCLEPIESLINNIYNLLHYNKIEKNCSIFNAFFNATLSLWCINH